MRLQLSVDTITTSEQPPRRRRDQVVAAPGTLGLLTVADLVQMIEASSRRRDVGAR
jgi:hypothetical protein